MYHAISITVFITYIICAKKYTTEPKSQFFFYFCKMTAQHVSKCNIIYFIRHFYLPYMRDILKLPNKKSKYMCA